MHAFVRFNKSEFLEAYPDHFGQAIPTSADILNLGAQWPSPTL